MEALDCIVLWQDMPAGGLHVNVAHLVVNSNVPPVAAALEDLCHQAVFEDSPDGFTKDSIGVRLVVALPPATHDSPSLEISLDGFGAEVASSAHGDPVSMGHYQWELVP